MAFSLAIFQILFSSIIVAIVIYNFSRLILVVAPSALLYLGGEPWIFVKRYDTKNLRILIFCNILMILLTLLFLILFRNIHMKELDHLLRNIFVGLFCYTSVILLHLVNEKIHPYRFTEYYKLCFDKEQSFQSLFELESEKDLSSKIIYKEDDLVRKDIKDDISRVDRFLEENKEFISFGDDAKSFLKLGLVSGFSEIPTIKFQINFYDEENVPKNIIYGFFDFFFDLSYFSRTSKEDAKIGVNRNRFKNFINDNFEIKKKGKVFYRVDYNTLFR